MKQTLLTPEQIQANREKYQSMLGKEVTLITTGKTVKGVVKKFSEDEHGFNLEINHEPVRWGDDVYVNSNTWARKLDDWGSLNNVKLITE